MFGATIKEQLRFLPVKFGAWYGNCKRKIIETNIICNLSNIYRIPLPINKIKRGAYIYS